MTNRQQVAVMSGDGHTFRTARSMHKVTAGMLCALLALITGCGGEAERPTAVEATEPPVETRPRQISQAAPPQLDRPEPPQREAIDIAANEPTGSVYRNKPLGFSFPLPSGYRQKSQQEFDNRVGAELDRRAGDNAAMRKEAEASLERGGMLLLLEQEARKPGAKLVPTIGLLGEDLSNRGNVSTPTEYASGWAAGLKMASPTSKVEQAPTATTFCGQPAAEAYVISTQRGVQVHQYVICLIRGETGLAIILSFPDKADLAKLKAIVNRMTFEDIDGG